MCTQKRVNSWEKLKSSQKKKSEGRTTRRLQSVCDISDICDKCDLGTQQQQGLTHEEHRSVCYDSNTSVRIVVQMCHGRSAFWRCYYVTLFLKCTLPAGDQRHLLTANFDSEVKCCKFRMNQHRRDLQKTLSDDELTSKGRSFSKRRLRYILVCWDYMSSSRTKKTIDT